jgi:hypothetical protein
MTYRYYEFHRQPGSEARVENLLALAAERNMWTRIEREALLTRVIVELSNEEETMLFNLLADHCDEY